MTNAQALGRDELRITMGGPDMEHAMREHLMGEVKPFQVERPRVRARTTAWTPLGEGPIRQFYWVFVAAFFGLLFASLPFMAALTTAAGTGLLIGLTVWCGDAIERVVGALWPYLKILLIIGLVIGFLWPFVTGAFAGLTERGIASVFTSDNDGGPSACTGKRLNDNALVAAHKTWPCGSSVKVTNQNNGKSIVVTIDDRGPFVRGRVIDLTLRGARELGFSGLAPVLIERL